MVTVTHGAKAKKLYGGARTPEGFTPWHLAVGLADPSSSRKFRARQLGSPDLPELGIDPEFRLWEGFKKLSGEVRTCPEHVSSDVPSKLESIAGGRLWRVKKCGKKEDQRILMVSTAHPVGHKWGDSIVSGGDVVAYWESGGFYCGLPSVYHAIVSWPKGKNGLFVLESHNEKEECVVQTFSPMAPVMTAHMSLEEFKREYAMQEAVLV